MSDSRKVSLTNIRDGAAVEKFDMALSEVIANVMDVNTPAEAIREIVLKVKVKPNIRRNKVVYIVDCQTKLAQPIPTEEWEMEIGHEDGEFVAKEQPDNQLSLPYPVDGDGRVVSINK